MERLYVNLKNKQNSLTKLKDSILILEELKKNSINEMLNNSAESSKIVSTKAQIPSYANTSEFNSFEKANFNSLENWDEFFLYCGKNEKAFLPNVEDSYLKVLKEIIYKIEMSSIVYENILSEIDEYELRVKIRDSNPEKSYEGEIQNKKEKVKVMQENFLSNLKELTERM